MGQIDSHGRRAPFFVILHRTCCQFGASDSKRPGGDVCDGASAPSSSIPALNVAYRPSSRVGGAFPALSLTRHEVGLEPPELLRGHLERDGFTAGIHD